MEQGNGGMIVIETDVLVVGGNPGGCAAAIAAARAGRRVLLLEPTKTLGGINANGVFGFDTAAPQALSGIAEEIGAAVRAHYRRIGRDDPLFARRSDQVWESHVLAEVWHRAVADTPGITLLCGGVPVAVVAAGGRIHEVRWRTAVDVMGNIDAGGGDDDVDGVARAGIVVDASYEGDVTAWAGAPCRIGREARSWLEPHAGAIFTNDVHPSPDGHLPHSVLPGSTGEGDGSIMAFACRLHCRLYADPSPDAPHRLKAPPPNYDPANYEWKPLAVGPDGRKVFFTGLYVLVNGKFLLNRMARGNELVGPNRAYILAHPAERRALRQRFVDHALGYLHFIQTVGGMPELGLADDEFADNGNIPYQLYIREGRRIDGHADLTEADINPCITGDGFRPPLKPDAVAIGDWTFESHVCRDDAPEGYVFPEGWILNRVTQAPYQIPYGCLLPKGVDNLLVAGPISASHIAFGAVRCEAARIQTGIAAGLAAALAVERGCRPADLPVADLQAGLVARGGKLTYFADVAGGHRHFQAIQWAALRSFVPPDPQWRFFPDHPVDWAEFVRATVVCLGLPISVTGAHFEQVPRHHPAFRYLETLYDLGTRAGIDPFGVARLSVEDPIPQFLRLYREPCLLGLAPDAPVTGGDAARFLALVAGALGGTMPPEVPAVAETDGTLLTRGALCALLRRVDGAVPSGAGERRY